METLLFLLLTSLYKKTKSRLIHGKAWLSATVLSTCVHCKSHVQIATAYVLHDEHGRPENFEKLPNYYDILYNFTRTHSDISNRLFNSRFLRLSHVFKDSHIIFTCAECY